MRLVISVLALAVATSALPHSLEARQGNEESPFETIGAKLTAMAEGKRSPQLDLVKGVTDKAKVDTVTDKAKVDAVKAVADKAKADVADKAKAQIPVDVVVPLLQGLKPVKENVLNPVTQDVVKPVIELLKPVTDVLKVVTPVKVDPKAKPKPKPKPVDPKPKPKPEPKPKPQPKPQPKPKPEPKPKPDNKACNLDEILAAIRKAEKTNIQVCCDSTGPNHRVLHSDSGCGALEHLEPQHCRELFGYHPDSCY